MAWNDSIWHINSSFCCSHYLAVRLLIIGAFFRQCQCVSYMRWQKCPNSTQIKKGINHRWRWLNHTNGTKRNYISTEIMEINKSLKLKWKMEVQLDEKWFSIKLDTTLKCIKQRRSISVWMILFINQKPIQWDVVLTMKLSFFINICRGPHVSSI